jgi:leucyl aminopeptidase
MSDAVKVGFVPFSAAARGILVVFCDDTLKFGTATAKALGAVTGIVKRAAATNQFKGKKGAALDILAPEGLKVSRLIVIGTGKLAALKDYDFFKFGGVAAGKLNAGNEAATIIAELPSGTMTPDQAAAVAAGTRLRAYKFDRYKTKKKDGEDAALRADISLAVGDVAAARKAFAPNDHIVDGVIMARELVNEPPNVLFPIEFARRAAQLRKLGVEVEILDVKAMTKLGMGALLGVAQGSTQPGRTVIMRWNGGKRGEQPVAFIGKGVCFDTGGISIKGAASMEDMKGDMGGAACVVGLLHALAARKAKLNVIGAIGLVENMPRRQRAASRRHRHLDVRPDHRDHQHRRRRPLGAGRPALVCGQEIQAEIHGRSRHPDRRHHGGARHRICRHVLQQRRIGRALEQGRAGDG